MHARVGVSYALIHQSEDLKWIQMVSAELCWGKILKALSESSWFVEWECGMTAGGLSSWRFKLLYFPFCFILQYFIFVWHFLHTFLWHVMFIYSFIYLVGGCPCVPTCAFFATQHDRNNVNEYDVYLWYIWVYDCTCWNSKVCNKLASHNTVRFKKGA